MKEKDLHLISSLILISFLCLFNLVNLILYVININEISLTKEVSDFNFLMNTIRFSLKIFIGVFFALSSFIFIFIFKNSPKNENNFYAINLLTLALNFDVFISSLFFMIDKIHDTNKVPITLIISLIFIGLSFILVLLSLLRIIKKKASLFLILGSIILVLFSYSLIVIKELEVSKINYIFVTKIVLLIILILVYMFYLLSYLSFDPVYEISIKHNEKYIDKQKQIKELLSDLETDYKQGKIDESKYLEMKDTLEKRLLK